MKNYILKYGIAGGFISSILGTLNWLLVANHVGVSGSQAIGYISITLSLLCIPLGIKYYRDNLNDGIVSIIQSLKIGLSITIVAGIVMALHSILFFTFQKDEFLEWQKADLSQKELVAFNEQLAQMPDFVYDPWFQGIVMFFMVFLIGALINLISAQILKKETQSID